MFNLVNVSNIFSAGISSSSQSEGRDQFALSNGWRARNESRQGQHNGQLATSPNDLEVNVNAERPRVEGHVDIVDIYAIESRAEADSFEGQGLQQRAIASLGGSGSRIYADSESDGRQHQESTQGAESGNRIQARISQPFWGIPDAPAYGSQMSVDQVHSDASTRNTQLQDIGQASGVEKTHDQDPKTGEKLPASESGGNTANLSDQMQTSGQKVRGRNYLLAEENVTRLPCSPVPYSGPQIGLVRSQGTADSLQAQNVDQLSLTGVCEKPEGAKLDKKLLEIATSGQGIQSGTEVTVTPDKARTEVQDAVAEQLSTEPEPGNDQYQVATQYAESSNTARSRNSGAQSQLSDQEVGSSRRWLNINV